MRLALAIGARGLGRTWPNPSVGCVIVSRGRIVGRGATQAGGRPHAETVALAQAGDAAFGATAYVSLEPCAHDGRTPPCVDGLIAAGIARVVTPIEDPDPRVAGQGHARLRNSGVVVETGLLPREAECVHRGFLMRVRSGRPTVTLKLATSFDGRIATASGESRWITGELARRRVHGLRLCHDGVLIGGGTARADDPALTVRGMGVSNQPVRIVASRGLDLPEDGALARTAAEVPLWLVHGDRDVDPAVEARWTERGARLISAPVLPGGRLDPKAMLTRLGDAGLTRIFCEGGGSLAASLLQADVVDEIVGFTAGLTIGAEGRPAIGALGLERLAEAPRFRLDGVEVIGPDVMHRWVRSA